MIALNEIAPVTPSLRALVQRLREEASIEKLEGDEAILDNFLKVLDETNSVLAALSKKEEAIITNADLSVSGRQKAMIAAVNESYGKLAFVSKKADQLRAAYESEKTAAPTPAKPQGDPVVQAIQGMEIRTRVAQLSLPEKMKVYETAKMRGEQLVVRVLSDESLLSLYDEDAAFTDFRQRVDREWLENHDKDKWQRLKALEFASKRFGILAGSIEGQMAHYWDTPSVQMPPIKTLDLGQKNQQAAPPKKASVDVPPKTVGAFV